MEALETLERDGFTARVEYDEERWSPRESMSNVGTMICGHRRYTLGDEQAYEVTEEELRERGARVILPLWLYDHSGLRIKVGSFEGLLPQGHAEFDTGQVGVIFDTPEGVKECIGEDATDEQIEAALRSEVEIYDQYLSGQVYSYVVENAAGEVVDSLCDIYGYEYAVEEAKGALAAAVEEVKS